MLNQGIGDFDTSK